MSTADPMGADPLDQIGQWLDAATPILLRRLDVAGMFTAAPPPVPWIVEPLLVRAHVTKLAGREGTGNSMLALALAAALGNGASVAGLEVMAPARVLYVDAENGPGEVHRRVHGLAARPEGLEYLEASGFDRIFSVRPRA